MRLTYFMALACASLAACTVNSPPVSNSATPAPIATPAPVATSGPAVIADRTVVDEQAMYAAEALYNVPAHAYVTADGNGQLTPAVKAAVKPKLVAMYAALKVARAAYSVGNSPSFLEALANLKRLSAEASALLPKAS